MALGVRGRGWTVGGDRRPARGPAAGEGARPTSLRGSWVDVTGAWMDLEVQGSEEGLWPWD